MSQRTRVVFISRQNSLRSVLAEACLRHLAPSKFVVASAGQPGYVAAHIHPAAVGALGSAGMALPAGSPKGWHTLLRSGARAFDWVIALDTKTAANAPPWPGQPDVATWPFPDIAAGGDEEETVVASIRMLYALRRRLELLANLPLIGTDRSAVRSDVRDLAHLR